MRIRALAMGAAVLSMACGVWLGLVRLGWNVPLPWPDELIAHGPLMVCGFLGTLISLERAVALGSSWGFAAPALVAAGALTIDLPLGRSGPLLITAGSLVTVAMFVVLWRRQAALFMAIMALGALAWAAGNVLWLSGTAIFRLMPWWLAFLVLTIAGERLELNRVLRLSAVVRSAFVSAATLVLAGAVASLFWPSAGVRLAGAGFLSLALWLAVYDIARRTVRRDGVTRYIAVGLLAGYGWLGFGGVLAIMSGVTEPGAMYDAVLHAVFLGFVMSMVFAHAPVIVPAVLGRPLPYAPRFYAHVVVLHASLALRVAGDLVEDLARWRAWGGLFNAVALAILVVNLVVSLALAPHPDGARDRGAPMPHGKLS